LTNAKHFGASKLISSPFFLILLLVLIINIIACTFQRLGWLISNPSWNLGTKGLHNFAVIPERNEGAQQTITKVLHKKHYKLRVTKLPEGTVISAQKGMWAPWASVLFHISLVGIGIGIISSYLWGFHAVLNVTEGQIAKAQRGSFIKTYDGRLTKNVDPGFDLGVAEFEAEYNQGVAEPTKVVSYVRVFRNHEILASAPVSPNNRIEYNGFQIMLSRFGLAPHLTLQDQNNKVIFDGFVNMDWAVHKAPIFSVRDSVTLPGTDIKLEMELFPDAKIQQDGSIISISNEPKLPLLTVNASENNQALFQGKALPGQKIPLSNGMTLMFDKVAYWNGFEVSKDPGVPVIFLFSLLGGVGLMGAVLLNQSEILVVLNAGETRVGGKSRRFRGLFEEEIAELVKLIELGKGEVRNYG